MTHILLAYFPSSSTKLLDILLGGEGFIVNETPDDDALAQCKNLGKQLAE